MRRTLVSWMVVLVLAGLVLAAPAVVEGPRKIPVAAEVDVVVVGGSTGAVAAAVAAAKSGATVFLAAPYNYLGEDMTATLQLWLEEGETPATPLAQKMFAPPAGQPTAANREDLIPFSYSSDVPSSSKHADTKKPSKLSDGLAGNASQESVQYDGDVTISLDLKAPQKVDAVAVVLYNARDYQVESVTVQTSADNKAWSEPATAKADAAMSDDMASQTLRLPVKGEAIRYVRLAVKRRDGSIRILLGEIEVYKPSGEKKPAPVEPAYALRATPMSIKRALDDALLEAKVSFLYGCLVSDVLRDADGKVCGIVMANRAGRQAIVAKTVIDATERSTVARLAGAQFRPFTPGELTFKRVVIGGEAAQAALDAGAKVREIEPPFSGSSAPRKRAASVAGGAGKSYPVREYTIRIKMDDATCASWAKADQIARDLTYVEGQQFTSDTTLCVPPDAVKSARPANAWTSPDALDLGALQPAGVERVWVLNGCADVPRDAAARLLRPLALMDVGTRVGQAAAEQAKAAGAVKSAILPGTDNAPAGSLQVREILEGVRPGQASRYVSQSEPRTLPVLGEYDVVVIGGGTSGAPAGISAGRQGAKVLVVEFQHGLGGVGTLGTIASYYHGYRGGFTAEVEGGSARWAPEARMEWWRKALRVAGADIWFGSIGCGAILQDGQIRGAVVATPHGRGAVLAKVVIDATGNADIAAAAGAPCVYTDDSELAKQGTGLAPRTLGATYTNTDFTIVDETDILDVWQTFVYAKYKYPKAFDVAKFIDTRERRTILGEFWLTIYDQLTNRTYPDTIGICKTNFDTHGYTVDPLFELYTPPSSRSVVTNMPYRCLLPKGLEGILVVGLGVSAHRDAIPLVRMQPDVQNVGYAAGWAAAAASRLGGKTRAVDLKPMQKHLVELGCVSESVLSDKDSFPLSDEQVQKAVESARKGYEGAAVLLSHRDQSLPLVRKAYEQTTDDKEKLIYAHILAVMGDATGAQTLLHAVESSPGFDKGWHYTGMGQFGRSMSYLDAYMVALGRLGDRRAVPVLLDKLKLLKDGDEFSHARALALGLEMLGDSRAAGPLAEALTRPNIGGHVIADIEEAIRRGGISNPNDNTVRAQALRELMLGRALFRCGDKDGIGRAILEKYSKDLRGHLARHAAAVLKEKDKK